MGRVVAVVNQKGGVGKTTVVAGLASCAMTMGHRVLIVDIDPQGASTWIAGIDVERVNRTLADAVASGRPGAARSAVVPSAWSHLVDVVPSEPALQRFEIIRGGFETWLGVKTELRLRRALEGVAEGYSLVLIDCPPSLGDLTTNALAAADEVLVVVEPTALSLRGVAPVADLIEQVWEEHNGELDLAGVVVNRMPVRGRDAAHHYAELARTMGADSVWDPPIPNRVAIAEASSNRRPIHDAGSRGADAVIAFEQIYDQLWSRIKPGSY